MTVETTSPLTGPAHRPPAAGRLRRWVARRPLTAFTVLVFAAGWPVLAVPALSAHGVLPGGALPVEPFVLAALLLVMLPAALGVTAVVDGRPGVRALLARALQWRFGAGWWAAVVLGLPVTTLAVGLASGRTPTVDGAAAVLLDAVVSIGTALLLVNLWEETVWAGFLQTRLQRRHGPGTAAGLTAVAFAGIHVPLQLTGEVTVASVASAVGLLLVLGLLVRVMAGVVLAGTGGSVLAVAVLHALFNASTAEDDLVDRLLSGGAPLPLAVLAAVLLTAAAAAALRARRRAGRQLAGRAAPAGSGR
jgi:membrane protease YdiL (CAAX protease family)